MDEFMTLARWYVISGAIARVLLAAAPVAGLVLFCLSGGAISIEGGGQ